MPLVVLAKSRKGDHVVRHADGRATVTLNKPPDSLDDVELGAIVVQLKGDGTDHLIGQLTRMSRIASDQMEVDTKPMLPAVGPLQYELYGHGGIGPENRWLMRMYLFNEQQARHVPGQWNVRNGVTKCDTIPIYKPSLVEDTRDIAIARPQARAQPIPEHFMCPIAMDWFEDPVVTPYGHSYSRKAIMEALQRSNVDPMTRLPLFVEDLISNMALRDVVEYVRFQR
jgi:U-box domain